MNQEAFTPAYSVQVITIYVSDADDDMVTAPVSLEEWCKGIHPCMAL